MRDDDEQKEVIKEFKRRLKRVQAELESLESDDEDEAPGDDGFYATCWDMQILVSIAWT